MTTIPSINPTTGTVIGEVEMHTDEQVSRMLKKSADTFREWKRTDISERNELLKNFADLLRKNKQQYGELITAEMGKVIKQAVPEVVKCATMFDYFADNAERMLEPEPAEELCDSTIHYEPMGTVLAIKPWNFPFWQVLSAAAHVLAGGNVMLLKHSSYVPMCALEIENIFLEAGFPEGVFQTMLIDGKTASSLIPRDEIKAVSFTGGFDAGQKVAELSAHNMKKFVLELGGSDPFLILDDANVEMAAKVAVPSRFINTGQTCIAAKRFIVMEEGAEEFTERFVEGTNKLNIGDPMDPETDIGPMVRDEQILALEAQVNDAISKGAKAIVPGGRMAGKGYMYSPTVLSNVTRDMKVMSEETFGPVAPIITVKIEEEAIELANDSEFGLGASVWSQDRDRAMKIASELETGMVGINSFCTPQACLPFGGVKKSGMGRELSRHGFLEFMNIKSVKLM
ncbi:NAD-dependent succinate-semialdehyde dehydrogenase [Methanolobus profundi]|uniref:Succinate-semialdehyde dehydrogenase / glutarate-semialdehyde dehydrogenase n=1 Tax=Methanolobus profundi TaxID=487685 RepID=A0A1I4T1G9_9EURY|nr:NAD-dependent succinate-semialdehyde dehydrogenase [Methanolobus profundi]SFM70457.1 succinate-semialdehyde dehydrogenase / glutarate-semialdehyde dehydrogenase [Methanolobus profundi]